MTSASTVATNCPDHPQCRPYSDHQEQNRQSAHSAGNASGHFVPVGPKCLWSIRFSIMSGAPKEKPRQGEPGLRRIDDAGLDRRPVPLSRQLEQGETDRSPQPPIDPPKIEG